MYRMNLKNLGEEKQKAFQQLVKEENLSPEKDSKVIENYIFTEKAPLRDDILDLIMAINPRYLIVRKLENAYCIKLLVMLIFLLMVLVHDYCVIITALCPCHRTFR